MAGRGQFVSTIFLIVLHVATAEERIFEKEIEPTMLREDCQWVKLVKPMYCDDDYCRNNCIDTNDYLDGKCRDDGACYCKKWPEDCQWVKFGTPNFCVNSLCRKGCIIDKDYQGGRCHNGDCYCMKCPVDCPWVKLFTPRFCVEYFCKNECISKDYQWGKCGDDKACYCKKCSLCAEDNGSITFTTSF